MGFEELPGLRDRIATRIRASQQAENLSESAWARRHGFSQHQVNAWVSAKSRTVPSLENLQKLAALFGMPWQALLIGSDGLDELCAFMRAQRGSDAVSDASAARGRTPAESGARPGEIVSVREVGTDVYEIRYQNGRLYRGPLRRFQDSGLIASAVRTQKAPPPPSRPPRRRPRADRKSRE
jgi:transcriptional regulator with XRE-family HTH domain